MGLRRLIENYFLVTESPSVSVSYLPSRLAAPCIKKGSFSAAFPGLKNFLLPIPIFRSYLPSTVNQNSTPLSQFFTP